MAQETQKSLMTLVRMKTGIKKGYLGKVPLMYFSSTKWKSTYKLKVELQNDFTAGYDCYPNNRQGTLMLLDKYTKSSVRKHTTSEGIPFSKRGGDSNKQLTPYDKNIGKICNASDSYIKVTQHHIAQNNYQY